MIRTLPSDCFGMGIDVGNVTQLRSVRWWVRFKMTGGRRPPGNSTPPPGIIDPWPALRHQGRYVPLPAL
jgi:hypothetical protein